MGNTMVRRNLTIGDSFLWMKQAFKIFKRNKLILTALTVIVVPLFVIPLLGAALAPLITARFAYCAHKAETQESFTFGEFWKNLFNADRLIKLSTINICIYVAFLLIQFLTAHSLAIWLVLVLALIVNTSVWIASIICFFNNDVKVINTLWLSLKIVLRNIIVFITFYILIALISVLVSLPIMFVVILTWHATHSTYILIVLGVIAYVVSMGCFSFLNMTPYFVYKSLFDGKSAI